MASPSHTHHEHTGEQLICAAREAFIDAGEQWTNMRALVFAELAKHERPISAYDIADNLSQTRGKRVAPNSIYRILEIFVATNLAMRIESANAFLANHHPGCTHDCIFLVCDLCEQATHIDDDNVSSSVRAIAASRNFRPERPVIEIRGVCHNCA